jgi:hypothetical protein
MSKPQRAMAPRRDGSRRLIIAPALIRPAWTARGAAATRCHHLLARPVDRSARRSRNSVTGLVGEQH